MIEMCALAWPIKILQELKEAVVRIINIHLLKAVAFMLFFVFRSSFALEIGKAAPELQARLANGSSVVLSAHRGKLIYLDFWASWCGPCRQSFPWMNALHEKYASKGFEIIAVNLDAKESDARQFLSEHPAKFTVAFDPVGVTPRNYEVKGMPSSYLIDREGRLLMIHSGFNEKGSKSLEQAIRKLMEEN